MSDENLQLLPWLVSEQLDSEERERVEAALAGSLEAADLLSYARMLHEAATSDDVLSSRLLVDYANDPESLDASLRRRIEEQLRADPKAGEAVAILRELEACGAAAEVPVAGEAAVSALRIPAQQASRPLSGRSALLEWLRRLVTRPVPAFVPAGIVLAALVLLWIGPPRWRPVGGRETQATTGGVQLLRLESVDRFRSNATGPTPKTPGSAPAIPTVTRSLSPLILELATGLDLDELAREGITPEVDLTVDGPSGQVLEQRLETGAFENGSVARILIPTGAIQEAGRYDVTMRYHAPGTPLDSVVAFETAFSLAERAPQ